MVDRPPAGAAAADLPLASEEVHVFIDPDGVVTICDLWEELLPLAEALGEVEPACPLPPPAAPEREPRAIDDAD